MPGPQMPSTPCISHEAMSSFLDGAGDPHERRILTAHIAVCRSCHTNWSEAMKLRRLASFAAAARQRRILLRLAFLVTALVLGTLAIVFSGVIQKRYVEYRYETRLGIRDVVRQANSLTHRLIAPRLSGPFAFRPLVSVSRSQQPPGEARDPWALRAAADTLRSKAGEGPNAETLHGLGAASLALGEADEALTSLRKAFERESGSAAFSGSAIARVQDATLLSDLGAAEYAAGVRDDRTESILTAIDLLHRAHVLQPRLAPAAFNLALAIERIHSRKQAIAAWNDYLQIETDGAWTAEAHEHLRSLALSVSAEETGTEPAETSARRIETELLPGWADAFVRGNGLEASRTLNEAATLAEHLRACCGDTFHRRAADMVEGAAGHDQNLATTLALAHQKYRDAIALYGNSQTSAARPLFQASRDLFQKTGDVFALRPWKYLAASDAYLGDARSALREATDAVSYCASDPACTPAARAHLQWVQALTSGRAGDPQSALRFYGAALEGFQSGQELENAASIHALIAENLEFLGVGEEAWPHRNVALKMAERNGTLDRIFLAFNEAAEAAMRRQHLTSARLYQDVVVEAARREHNTLMFSNALFWRGKIRHAAGDAAGAERDLDEAVRLSAQVGDAKRRTMLQAGIAAARAEGASPADAARELTTAIQFFSTNDNHYRLAELYAARAAANEALGQASLTEDDYAHCIAEVESSRGTLEDDAMRERFFAQGSGIFDRAIRHLWLGRRTEDAFRLAEQSRGREVFGLAAPPLLTTRELSAAERPEDAVVEYALLEDRLVIWIIRRSSITSVERPVTAASIANAVEALQEAFQQSGSVEPALQRVASIVYDPIAPLVRDAKRIVIVANKSLRAIPFGALRDPATHHYLIEAHEIAVAPSAASYAAALRRDRALRRDAPPSVLVSSYTRGDATRGLLPLQYGREEAAAVPGIYGHVEVLAEAAATPGRVLDAVSRSTVAHIVAHSVEDSQHPEYSSIALAPDGNGRDLYARDIASAALRSTRLVFLSSCGTAGRISANDAPLTVAESFLAAGVPVVVGSLRPVDDAKTVAFALALHRAFAASGDAVAALRTAQLYCLRSPERHDPRFWSTWIAIGGGA